MAHICKCASLNLFQEEAAELDWVLSLSLLYTDPYSLQNNICALLIKSHFTLKLNLFLGHQIKLTIQQQRTLEVFGVLPLMSCLALMIC